MSLNDWAHNGWLRAHATSKQEIRQLLQIVDRDLSDARQKGLSADWRFGIAYNAALKLCTVLIFAEGFRPEKSLAHYRTLQALPLILGPSKVDDADYLNACRAKRNVVEYDYIGGATDTDADELISFTVQLKIEVLDWVKKKHPGLL
jgi:hypothetical protein